MSKDDKGPLKKSTKAEIKAFLDKAAQVPITHREGQRGRLIFAIDATNSRSPTWDRACHIQGEMFEETAALGGLEIQVCYYRGHREFGASPWFYRSSDLLRYMTAIHCRGGLTQIARVLIHALDETRRRRVDALVFVGDCMEEDADRLAHIAGQLGLLGVPVFLFQEGWELPAENTFKKIAQLTRGAYCSFDATSAQQLRDLLSAVAVYVSGGHRALEDYSRRRGGATRRLIHQLKGK